MPAKGLDSGSGSGTGSNKSILSFFHPKPQQSPTTPKRPSHTPSAYHQALPQPPSSPLSSRYGTPVRKAPAKLEIGASDDEDDGDDFSDDSLEDLSALLGKGGLPKPGPSPDARGNDPNATPKSKRIAVEIQPSPLGFVTRHKFDLKTLAKDAKRDDATNVSSLRAKNAVDSAMGPSPKSRGDDHSAFVDIVKGESGKDADKVLRAVQRSEPAHMQARYCFFNRDYRVPPSSPTPKLDRNSPWQLLTKGNAIAKERNLASGIPQTILVKTGGLPDVLFQWILDEICIQRSYLLRQEYCNIIEGCPDLVETLLTPERLEELFLRLGATDEISSMKDQLTISNPSHEPYQERDWSCLESFLILLGMTASRLPASSVEYAIQVLLRLSLDKMLICNVDLLTVYEDTVQLLVQAVPESSWDSFCFETCSLIHTNVDVQFIRTNALSCIPVRGDRTHDLRRRLAVAFLFDDPALARHHSEETVTVRDVTERLCRDDFAITPRTDFAELRALVLLLDMALDDGSAAAAPFEDEDEERRFNEDVDQLVAKLGEIWRKINDAGMKLARTEAKSVVEWVKQRISQSVRTRKKVKHNIFDMPESSDQNSLPKQQEYMSKFLQKGK